MEKIIITLMVVFMFVSFVDADNNDIYKNDNDILKEVESHIFDEKSIEFCTDYEFNPNTFSEKLLSKEEDGTKTYEPLTSQGDYYQTILKNIEFERLGKKLFRGKVYNSYRISPNTIVSKQENDYINITCENVGKEISEKVNGNDVELVKQIAEYVTNLLSYEVISDKSLYQSLMDGKGQCHHYSIMFYKIAKSAGINARYIKGNAYNPNGEYISPHAWNMVYVNGEWYNCDLTWADSDDFSKWLLRGKNDEIFAKTHVPSKEYVDLIDKTNFSENNINIYFESIKSKTQILFHSDFIKLGFRINGLIRNLIALI